MITLSGTMLTQLELIDIVFKYADGIKDEDKHVHVTHMHVLEILKNIPEEQRWPEQIDINFIRVCLLEKGVGKISEIKEYHGEKEKPRIPFHQLSTERSDEGKLWYQKGQYA